MTMKPLDVSLTLCVLAQNIVAALCAAALVVYGRHRPRLG